MRPLLFLLSRFYVKNRTYDWDESSDLSLNPLVYFGILGRIFPII